MNFSTNNKDREGTMLRLTNGEFDFFHTSGGLGVPAFTRVAEILANGDLNILGTMGTLSDRNAKKDIEEVDTSQILDRLDEMPIATWRYLRDDKQLHMGPMAQDFWKQFKLGRGDKMICVNDTIGVALASAQELSKQMKEKDKKIDELEKRNEELEKRLLRIEQAIQNIK